MVEQAHASRFQVMRALSGELTEEESAELEAHLTSCSSCRAVSDELFAVQSDGERRLPPLELPARVLPFAPKRALIAIAAAAAAAAAAGIGAVVLNVPAELRAKGGVIVHAHCLAPGESVPRTCASGDRVRPGTSVMITVELDSDRYLLLRGADRSNEWRILFPIQGTTALEVSRVTHDFLGHSVVFDATPGEELLELYSSRAPFDARDLSGVEVTKLYFEKELP